MQSVAALLVLARAARCCLPLPAIAPRRVAVAL